MNRVHRSICIPDCVVWLEAHICNFFSLHFPLVLNIGLDIHGDIQFRHIRIYCRSKRCCCCRWFFLVIPHSSRFALCLPVCMYAHVHWCSFVCLSVCLCRCHVIKIENVIQYSIVRSCTHFEETTVKFPVQRIVNESIFALHALIKIALWIMAVADFLFR